MDVETETQESVRGSERVGEMTDGPGEVEMGWIWKKEMQLSDKLPGCKHLRQTKRGEKSLTICSCL